MSNPIPEFSSNFTYDSVLNAGASIMPSFSSDYIAGTVTLGQGEYVFASDNIGTPPYYSFTLPGSTFNVAISSINYIVARYNDGFPDIVVLESNNTVDNLTQYPIFVVARGLSSIGHIALNNESLGLANKLALRTTRTNPIRPNEGGLLLTTDINRGIVISDADVWFGSTHATLSALSSFTHESRFWRHVGGEWTYLLDNQFNNEAWDNGTHLVELTNNRYAVTYVYRSIGINSNIIHFIAGRGDYKLGEAQAALVPLDIPEELKVSALVGRIIIEKFDTIPIQIDNKYESTPAQFRFQTDHEFFINLLGGDTSGRYHLSSIELTYLQDLRPALSANGTNINAFGIVSAGGGNSGQWNSTYTTVLTNSASWGGGGDNTALTIIQANSANWNSAYTITNSYSANWQNTYTTFFANSANWQNTYNLFLTNSANWNSVYNTVRATSGNWNNVYNTVQSTSSKWESVYNTVQTLSSNWQNTYTTFFVNSANWQNTYNTVRSNSANWQNTFTTVSANSANWQNTYNTVRSNSANWQNTFTTVSANSANWQNTYNTFRNVSSTYVPYISATSNVDLGTFKLSANMVTITSLSGVVLRSPNGNRWRLTVSNTGVLSAVATT